MLKRRIAVVTAGLVCVVVVAAAGFAIWQQPFAHRPVAHTGQTVHIISPPPVPAAVPPPTLPPAPAVPHDGLRIRMPEIGIDLPIVEGDGYDAPLYEAAHYPGTTWPG